VENIMKRKIKLVLFVLFIQVLCLKAQENRCKTYSIDPVKLEGLRQLFLKNEIQKDKAFITLTAQAEKLLNMKLLSVMDKGATPPSGDKHDFLSMGPYWWPDPSKPNGLPYIRKDGERNPEIKNYPDDHNFNTTAEAVSTLSIAYYITKESKYSSKAAQLLRCWFLDEKTKMNPNLNYAQFIPGVTDGRGIGIIGTRAVYKIVDAVGILNTSIEWTGENDKNLRKWLNDYFVWLTTSKNGIDESKEKNNHGTWYDVQVISLSLFLNNIDAAKKYLEDIKINRISSQIEPDGKQPLELARTNSWGYSLMNLSAFFHLAVLGNAAGVDLWNYQSVSGGSLRKALDYLLSFALNHEQWKYQVISEFNNEELYPLIVKARNKYDEKTYSDWLKKIFADKTNNDIENLL
jgi:hypothetical protein